MNLVISILGGVKCVLLNYRSEDSCSLESCSSRDAETTNNSVSESIEEKKLLDLTLTHHTIRSKIKVQIFFICNWEYFFYSILLRSDLA